MSTATFEIAAPDVAAPGDIGTQDPASRIYRGRTVEELIQKIQAELGRDAIVLRRESGLTGGFAGFFQRPYVEIEARRGSPGIDCYDEADRTPAMPGDLDPGMLDVSELAVDGLDARGVDAGGLGAEDLDAHGLNGGALDETTLADLLARSQPARALPTTSATSNGHEAPAVGDQLVAQNGKDDFHELTAAGLRTSPTAIEPAQPEAPRELRATDPFAAALAEAEAAVNPPAPVSRSRARDAIERKLLGGGVGEAFVHELLEAATAHVMPFMPPRTSLARAVEVALRERIPTPRVLAAGNATIAVVGPGGAGKTTCCTALLDAYGKRSSLPAACVTIIDGARRGELQMILGPDESKPLSVTDSAALAALRAAREEGVLLLDTPPVSCAEPTAIQALAALLGELRADRVVLALPATLGSKPAAQLLKALRPLNADAVAITHADETDQFGVAIDAACSFGLAPVYIVERGGGLAQVERGELAERLLAAR
jgi:flagellar biosynthesis GTPase FlhF